ncbi:ankyrin repeat-containing protein [Penicillium verhagenii]|uniref:ankyrin repeat-containing protein n=1 Tax=Penicillium verhagenii TaxID=1562060 RepID=UPI0025454160|nr:ankyrin repeat-containing protein [Penicillium verhagenii]KAJ5936682.1 ankyrin repeat-containing protein [Penicillium verhagenii]
MYNEAMKRIEHQPSISRLRARKALAWLTFATRPLSITEMEHALALEGGDPHAYENKITTCDEILSVCAGLATVDKKTMSFEYLERTQSQWLMEDDESNYGAQSRFIPARGAPPAHGSNAASPAMPVTGREQRSRSRLLLANQAETEGRENDWAHTVVARGVNAGMTRTSTDAKNKTHR